MTSSDEYKSKANAIVSPLLDLLPDELILEIFNHLTLLDLVLGLYPIMNKRLRRICKDPKFCTSVYLLGSWDTDTARKVVLMVAGPYLKVLGLQKREDDFNSLAILALKRSPNLEWLKSSHEVPPSDSLMSTIGREASSIRKFTLRGPRRFQRVTDRLSQILVSNATSLRNLRWIFIGPNYDSFNDDFINAIADNCKQLEHFSMESMPMEISDKAFNHFLDQVCGTLKHLALRIEFPTLTDASFRNLKLCVHLEVLKLMWAGPLGAQGMKAITRLTKLRKLELYDFLWRVPGEDYTGTFGDRSGCKTIMHNLTSLLLEMCCLDDVDLEVIAKSCPNLEELDVLGNFDVGDRGVISVLNQCKKLTCLWLSASCGVTAKALVGNIKHLKYLNVSEALMMEVAKAIPKCEAFRGACLNCSCMGPHWERHYGSVSLVGCGMRCMYCLCAWSKHVNLIC